MAVARFNCQSLTIEIRGLLARQGITTNQLVLNAVEDRRHNVFITLVRYKSVT